MAKKSVSIKTILEQIVDKAHDEEHRLILESICNKDLKGAVHALEQKIQ